MKITAVASTVFYPFGGARRVTPPARPPFTFLDADIGTLIRAPGGGLDPDAGTLIDMPGGMAAATMDPEAGTLLFPS